MTATRNAAGVVLCFSEIARPRGPRANDTAEEGDCNHTRSRPTVKIGSSGDAVKQAQCYLNLSVDAEKLVEDGLFGPLTDAATKKFQQCADIIVDGIVGPQTWSFLTFWANSPKYVC